jgi:AraC-like DNA-binding protein
MNEAPFFSSRVCKVITFINVNFANPTSLQEICLAVNLSEQHAEKIFKQEVGVPIKKFQILKRLYEAACTLRSDPKTSENYVLSYCGFDDVSNFIRQFKKHFGCAPIKFRNCNRNPRSCGLWKQSYFHVLVGKRELREALGTDISHPCALFRITKANK